jgi:hypothetical protein
MDGWTDEWMDGWIDGWMGGWMDGWIYTTTEQVYFSFLASRESK